MIGKNGRAFISAANAESLQVIGSSFGATAPGVPNPYASNTLPPCLTGLESGADAFGLVADTSESLLDRILNPTMPTNLVSQASASSELLVLRIEDETLLSGVEFDNEDFEVLAVLAPANFGLVNPQLGANDLVLPMLSRGFLNSPFFGGSGQIPLALLEASNVYATILPNGFLTSAQIGFGGSLF